MIIETARLIIRPLVKEDVGNYHDLFSNPVNLTFETFHPLSFEQSKEALQQWINVNKETGGHLGTMEFGIELKQKNEIIGIISGFFQDVDSSIMEFGIAIMQKFCCNGYAYEASVSFLQNVFSTTSTHRVFSACDAANVPCMKLLRKLGMQQEGHFRKSVKMPDGNYHDEVIFAVLKEDFVK
jgi:[ribosomal protein S5]-alanine N-acetyltransferase